MNEQEKLKEAVAFFNIFKETAANNIGMIHGFPNWTRKMDFVIDGDDILIKIPAALIKYGDYDRISRSKKRKEADMLMQRKKYTFLEFVIKKSVSIYVAPSKKIISGFSKSRGE